MESRHIEITTLDMLPFAPEVPPAEPSLNVQKNWSRVLGVLGTLLVHAVALNSVGWGSAHRLRPHEAQGIGSVRVETHATPSEELLLLNLDSTQKGESDLQRAIASLLPPASKSRIAMVSSEPLAVMDDADMGGTPNPATDAGDPTVRALMAGRYRGQIGARIERAWVRPRVPVAEALDTRALDAEQSPDESVFNCEVQIRQDGQGNVEEVLLLNCNGTEAWRHSLVVAVNQASPLPAPPIPSVFSRSITMTFRAQAYEPRDNTDAYAPESPDFGRAPPANSLSASPARPPNMGIPFRWGTPK